MRAATACVAAIVLGGLIATSGCCNLYRHPIGQRPVWPGFSCGFWEARAAKRGSGPSIPPCYAAIEEGLLANPQPANDQRATVRPPHSRFHPVPTQHVFAAREQYHPPQPIAAPDSRPLGDSRPSPPDGLLPMFLAPDAIIDRKTPPPDELSPPSDAPLPLPPGIQPMAPQKDDPPPLPADASLGGGTNRISTPMPPLPTHRLWFTATKPSAR